MEKRGGGGGYENFTSKIFCLTVPKSSVGESFTVALISGTEKVWIRGGKITIFCRKFFVSQCRKNFVGESFSVALISGTEKVWIGGGGGEYHDFPSNFFCLTVPKISVGESFTVAIISGIEKVWIRGGSIAIFCRNFLSHSVENFRRGILYCCINFGNLKSLNTGVGV